LAGERDLPANRTIWPEFFEEEAPMAASTAAQKGAQTVAVSMTVNGKPVTGEIDARTLLVQFLREQLRLTGTHVGCDTSQCGACVVHVNGVAIKSCTALALALEGADVLTIEGLAAPDGPLHPMQEAFRENHGLQCGYCTPGMIMTAVDMVRRKGNELDDRTIREELEGNICRCTGYHNIVKAIAAGARAMKGMSPSANPTSKAAE
jgi:carbon-monoxide dehydrogenase small subunit